MDPPVKVRLKEVDGAPALPPAMSSLLEEIAQVFKSLQSLHQEEADNRVTVALLPLSSHRPPPRPYLHASSSHSAVSDYRRMSLSYMQNSGFTSSVLHRAQEVKSNLGLAFPTFLKSLVRSHVASCFWMGLPAQFCKTHLPEQDTNFILEDECGKLSVVKYIAQKTGLSAGWKQFSARHNLLEGDVLIFQLVEPTKFKVYIIRANNIFDVDGGLGLPNLDSQTKENNADENAKVDENAFNTSKRKYPKSFPLAVAQKKNKNMDLPRSVADPDSNYESEEVGSEVLEEIKLFSPSVQFKDVRNFEDFKIVVDGMIIDAELSEDHRHKYYKLCCSQNAYLHENLISGINCKLISGSISETVNIADAIRASKLTTSREEFINWDKTLSGLEMLGMNTGFIRTRLHQLVSLVLESESSNDTRRYVEAKTEQAQTHNEMRNIEARLVALKEASTKCSVDIESLKWKAERYELKLKQVAFAPW